MGITRIAGTLTNNIITPKSRIVTNKPATAETMYAAIPGGSIVTYSPFARRLINNSTDIKRQRQ